MTQRFVKYNPSFLETDQLIANFVVRHTDFELIMGIIRDNDTDANQHVLVVGPRGSGKTTLVLRVAAEIERNKDLSERWYPLVFAEESYEVASAGEFWLEALFHLAEQTGDEKWKRTYAELRDETGDLRLEQRSLAQLRDFADSQGKRILLIVENLNMLFNDLISEDQAWNMRHALMNEPKLMLLATAVSRFENIESSSHALFEMFKIHELKRLDEDECNNVWELITGKKLTGEQIRPITILTGGNPRLLTIIAKFSAHRSFGKLLDDLVDLIDDHTEYFKSHLDNLPAIERKVYLALAELWNPSTAREVAKAARLDVNKTSSFLKRLVGRGAVIVATQDKKTNWYAVAERMYNIYYLMRRRGKPADRVKATVKFMIALYDPESATKLIFEEAGTLPPDRCRDHYLAYAEIIQDLPDRRLAKKIIAATPKGFLESPYIDEALKDFRVREEKGGLNELRSPAEIAESEQITKMIEQGHQLFQNGDYAQVIEKLDMVIGDYRQSDDITISGEVARAMFNKGVTIRALNRPEEEIAAYDELIARYQYRPEPQIAELVAMAMSNKGVTLGELNRPDEEIRLYDELIVRYKDRLEPRIAEVVAGAMNNKSIVLGALNRSDEEIRVYDQLIARYQDRPEPQIAEQVARAMFNKGVTLRSLNRSEEEIAAYDKLIARYQDRPEPQIAAQVARAMVNKGVRHGALNRSDEEIRVYDELIARYQDRTEPEIAEVVAGAMHNKGMLLGPLNRSDEAIRVYDELIARYQDRTEPEIAEQVAKAMFNKGFRLDSLGKYEEAENTILQLIELKPDLTDAHIHLIELRLKLPDRQGDALSMAEEIIAKRPEDPTLLNAVACAFYRYGTPSLLEKAETWARGAVAISPNNLSMLRTLSCILAVRGNSAEAVEAASRYIQDADLAERSLEDAIELFVALAASGYAKEALGILEKAPAKRHLEPLVVALRLYTGEDVKVAVEILEVAKDVVKRIEDRKQMLK